MAILFNVQMWFRFERPWELRLDFRLFFKFRLGHIYVNWAMTMTIGPWLWPNFTKSLYKSRVVVVFLPFLYQTAVLFNVQKWFPILSAFDT